MTIINLVLIIAVVAAVVAGLHYAVKHKMNSVFISFLQYFTGILFLFSGWVKAVDPLGTAFKLQDYFAEFYTTCEGTFLNFLAPIFPLLSQYATSFAIFMIVFEIVLGVMLILGDRPKLTAWLFFLLVVFFTVLTGFTYLTGYVPSDQNFFNFSAWGPYKLSNMRVTDCGCFGDFIKLEPKISFFKDLFLLIPAFYFLFNARLMHQWLNQGRRNVILFSSTILLIFYCVYNFYWNEPHVDFRPFKNGTNVAQVKAKEIESNNSVQILEVVLKDKVSGTVQTIPFAEYMSNFKKYEGKFEVIDQIKSLPPIPTTKIFDFEVKNYDDDDVTGTYLENAKPHFMIMAYKPKYHSESTSVVVQDTTYQIDSIAVGGIKDSFDIKTSIKNVTEKTVEKFIIHWDQDFLDVFKQEIQPLQAAAAKDNIKFSVVTSGLDKEKAEDLKAKTGLDADFYTADEKTLKTIMRSNPGIVLWKGGVLLHKWHYKKLPSYAEIKAEYLK